ncbi:unnamed protein product [Phytophthora fragariaefolia]|uniref:Unnamed protein product n=1 Tax=Phytophthora fragariaefolia TaxID=1490495 RepID=A0A9W6UDR3_9STRA|nr:unnamed protein product [Phytophthora fragariaefolia]
MPQPVLDLGLLSKDAAGEESKFDDVMALQEEPVQVGAAGRVQSGRRCNDLWLLDHVPAAGRLDGDERGGRGAAAGGGPG